MERLLDEIFAGCERAYAEEKSGTRERSILSMTTKGLRKCLQEPVADLSNPPKSSSALSSATSTPARPAGGPDANPDTQPTDPAPAEPVHEEADPRRRLLSSSDSISRLAYACRVSLVGDKAALSDKAAVGGSVARANPRALILSLELAAVLLNSGAIPTGLQAPPPVFDIAMNPSGGAQAFFSKILGGGAAVKAGKGEETGASAAAADGGGGPEENVRDAVVDAVLAASPMALSKESTEKLLFVYITALLAAAVPRVCRTRADQLGDGPDELRFSSLALHGHRLIRVMRWLYSILTRPGTSPVLIDEVKTALHQIVKSLSKYTETEIRGTAGAVAYGAHGGTGAVAGADLVNVLEFCAAIGRVAPLSLSGMLPPHGTNAAQAAAAAGMSGVGAASGSSRASLDASVAALVSDGTVAPFATHAALVSSLGFILHIVVNGGYMFRKMENVIQCIRQSVIPVVVRTSLSNETDAFRLSLNLLLACCVTFGPRLVNETATVFRHVYFRVLESKFTSFTQKAMVIEAFQRYIEEPQNLIALFLNYDCNTRSQSIYEEMINYLGAMAKVPRDWSYGRGAGKATSPSLFSDPSETTAVINLEYDVPEELRRKAMQTLLLVAESNIQWIERFETDHNPTHIADMRDEAAQLECVPSREPTDAIADAHSDGLLVPSDGFHAAAATPTGTIDHHNSSTSGNDNTFLEARRYKDALKKFLYLFNDKAKPEAAIEYLKDCVLMSPVPGSTAPTGATPAVDATAADVPDLETEPAPAPAPAPSTQPGEERPPGPEESVEPLPTEAELAEAAQVARFLYDRENWIDKLVLGEYFAKSFRKTDNRLVFEEWVKLYDFTGLRLDEALRMFLGGFKLLGEAQIVDRTMEIFAAQYCRQNPTVFTSADTAFILSFSICMLNTDAHSAHIKDKMTAEGFVRNNKGIDEGHDVDPAILNGIFERISCDEIVLRPSENVAHTGHGNTGLAAGKSSGDGRGGSGGPRSNSGSNGSDRFSGGLLGSIPILRHLAPLANVITDKVLLPMDAMGNNLFGGAQRKREEMYQEELRAALREVSDALRSSAALPDSAYVAATSIENALPMWQVTVDLLCRRLVSSLLRIFEESEQYVSPLAPAAGSAGGGGPGAHQSHSPEYDAVRAYMRETNSYEYFQVLLQGLTNTIRVCCSFGNISHTEVLLEQSYQMTQLSQTIIITTSATAGPQVQAAQALPRSRLELLVTFINLFINHGDSFGSRGWQAGYTAVSLVDLLANGIEGLWKRQSTRLLQRVNSGPAAGGGEQDGWPGADASPLPRAGSQALAAPRDVWFGVLQEAPRSTVPASRKGREQILTTIRSIPGATVDLWLERLFDATQYPMHTQLQMANGLSQVCQKELQHSRTFSLTKLFDFVAVCASYSTRLQWRELWANVCPVFVLAGQMNEFIASQSLDGLRIIAMTYLMREELLNYSFQKEVLKPFEDILMNNQDVFVRRRVVNIISELIDIRTGHLASGWHVVFTCLSHAAVIPEVVSPAWEVCERIMVHHVSHMKDCFSDLIFCLTTFSCTNEDEQVPLKGVSYLVACGHWLQYGLEPPPADARDAAAVLLWACRFRSADAEARAAQTLGKNLVRVTIATEPLTLAHPLTKPDSYVSKTNYHLWMSLFEGLIPIVVVHASARVRAYAVSAICALLRHYGPAFAVSVQDSLFESTLRPVLATLLSHVPGSGDSMADRADYRMLAFLALRGLVQACCESAHLLELGCSTILHLSSSLSWSLEVVENDLVDIWVRVCCDMLSAVTPEALSGGDSAAGSTTGSRNASFSHHYPPVTDTTSLRGSFGVDPGLGDTPPHPPRGWSPEPLPDRKAANPFFLGLLHQVQQMGTVDVKRLKRTAGWVELHAAAAAGGAQMRLPPGMRDDATAARIRETVFRCLADGLVVRLAETVTARTDAGRAACLAYTRAIRHAMLGVTFYCVATRDVSGVGRLLDLVRAFSSPMSRFSRRRNRGGGTTVSRPGDGSAHAAQPTGEPSEAEAVDTPVELLLCVPTAAVLVEFIFCFPMDSAAAAVQMLRKRVAVFLGDLAAARQHCLDAQLAEQASSGSTSGDGVVNFASLFRSCRAPIAGDATTTREAHGRTFREWKYLVYLLSIRCALSLGRRSVLGACVDAQQLFRLLPLLPSELEETAVGAFERSCWEELDLHCNMPEGATFTACLSLLQYKLAFAASAATPSSVSARASPAPRAVSTSPRPVPASPKEPSRVRTPPSAEPLAIIDQAAAPTAVEAPTPALLTPVTSSIDASTPPTADPIARASLQLDQ